MLTEKDKGVVGSKLKEELIGEPGLKVDSTPQAAIDKVVNLAGTETKGAKSA